MKSMAPAIALVMTATLWVAPTSGSAPNPVTVYQKQVFSATNQQRAKHDRPKFRKQTCVQRFAVKQAKKMARQERMFHQDLSPILRSCGLDRVGENVAFGFPLGPLVVTAWMHSTGHRRNILNREYRLLGVGARKSKNGVWYAAQVFGRKA